MVDRKLRVTRWFLVMGILILGLTLGMTCRKKNQPPGAPSIPSGPTSGRKGDTLRFSTIAEDPDGDSVAVRFDWGDSAVSDWSASVPNGVSVMMAHAWLRSDTYLIRAQARDVKETASIWSGERQLSVPAFPATFGGASSDEGSSVQRTSDGGYIITGWTESFGAGGSDVWLVKTNSSGDKVWDKTFGGTGSDFGHAVEQASDGGYVIVGSTQSYGAGGSDLWLIKTDASGCKVWDRTFGGAASDYGAAVQKTSDGGYVLLGTTVSYGEGNEDVWLVKTDESGNRAWDKTYGGTSYGVGRSVQQTSDGGYIISGSIMPDTGSGHRQALWLIRTDTLGNRVWDRTFGETGYGGGFSVQQIADGGFVIAGYTDSQGAGYSDVWLVKTDSLGREVLDKTFGGGSGDFGSSVRQTYGGGYIIAGSTLSYGAGGSDVWLIKTDVAGDKVWDRTFGGAGNDWGSSVQQTSDGGYIITGRTDSYGSGQGDLWLIKTDAEGN
jgi:hypothetical protein